MKSPLLTMIGSYNGHGGPLWTSPPLKFSEIRAETGFWGGLECSSDPVFTAILYLAVRPMVFLSVSESRAGHPRGSKARFRAILHMFAELLADLHELSRSNHRTSAVSDQYVAVFDRFIQASYRSQTAKHPSYTPLRA